MRPAYCGAPDRISAAAVINMLQNGLGKMHGETSFETAGEASTQAS